MQQSAPRLRSKHFRFLFIMRLVDREKTPMIQAKFDLDESQFKFLNQYEQYGFRDESELIRTALTRLQQELQRSRLEESATLYAELYAEDEEVRSL
jgi:Arc/MetJ-type ribon-helix-helix transcriptional regulator